VQAVITGRRATQGADRADLQPIEVDATGLVKVNPLFAWTFAQVRSYIDDHEVPRNALLAQGYRSVGDWHSTVKSSSGDAGERAGRWAGKEKTECGLHQDYFKLKLLAMKKQVSFVLTELLVRLCSQRPIRSARRSCVSKTSHAQIPKHFHHLR
jgi:phosphoadenosine phosphosulfate reductase